MSAVAQELERHGILTTYIGGAVGRYSRRNWRTWIIDSEPDVVVVPRVDHANRLRAHIAISRKPEYDPLILVVPSEYGNYGVDQDGNCVDFPLQSVPGITADLVCCISPNEKQALIHYFPDLEQNNVVITGHPKHDLYSERYRCRKSRAQILREFGISPEWSSRRIISVASRYDFRADLADDMNHPRALKFLDKSTSWGFSESRALKLWQFLRHGRTITVSAVKELASENEDVLFIYKMHPGGEDETYYHSQFSRFRNIVILDCDCGNIGELLPAVDLHIHTACGTAYDAFFSKVPTINYVPFRRDEWPVTTWARNTQCNMLSDLTATSFDQLTSAVEQFLSTGELQYGVDRAEDVEGFVEKNFFRVDGASSLRVAEQIMTRISGSKQKANKLGWTLLLKRFITAGLTRRSYPRGLYPYYDFSVNSVMALAQYRFRRMLKAFGK